MIERRSGGALLAAALVTALAGCGPSDLLGPEAEQGIEGIALLGPMCPVQRADDSCPDRPYQAWVTIRNAGGATVTRFRTDEDGRFRVGLRPGRYELDPQGGNPFPATSPLEVDVVSGAYTDVVIGFDTGIR